MNKKEIFLNYKRNNRWLGIIDYKSLTAMLIYLVILWHIINFFCNSLEITVYIFISLSIPPLAFLFVNLNNESAIDVIFTLIKFVLKRKIYTDTSSKTNLRNKVYYNSNYINQ